MSNGIGKPESNVTVLRPHGVKKIPNCSICDKEFGVGYSYVIIVEPYKSLVCLECASVIAEAYDKDI